MTLDEILARTDWVEVKVRVLRDNGPRAHRRLYTPGAVVVEVLADDPDRFMMRYYYPYSDFRAEVPLDRIPEVAALIEAVARRVAPRQ